MFFPDGRDRRGSLLTPQADLLSEKHTEDLPGTLGFFCEAGRLRVGTTCRFWRDARQNGTREALLRVPQT